MSQRDNLALYPILEVKVSGTNKEVTVFCDSGSDPTFITSSAAQRIKAKRLNKSILDVTTMGNIGTTYDTVEYEFTLQTISGKKVEIKAFGMDNITGQVSKLNIDTVSKLFPEFDAECLQRKDTSVDMLLGCEYFGLHSKKEEAKSGDHLSVMSGDLGICLQGAHPLLKEETVIDTNVVKTIHDRRIKSQFQVNHAQMFVHQNFIQGKELVTETTPRCGRCRCNKCPTVGHTYSFKEEQELKLIQENLEYDEQQQRWITSYPWTSDPSTLPNNYSTALSTLKSTERKVLRLINIK